MSAVERCLRRSWVVAVAAVLYGVASQLALADPPPIAQAEGIVVSDSVQVLTPVSVLVEEVVGVHDALVVVGPASIAVTETIVVGDTVAVLTPAVIEIAESISVFDASQSLPPFETTLDESIVVTDEVHVSVPDPDGDDDGADDALEAMAPNGGDGNDDGIPDRFQPAVASRPDATGVGYVTVSVTNCTALHDVTMVSATMLPSDTPFQYPFGLASLRVPCAQATVEILFHAASSLSGPYRSYGPTTPGQLGTVAWYSLPTAAFSTVTIGGASVARVTLTLEDGLLGDDTDVDGEIRSLGGPASTSVPSVAPLGLVALAITLTYASLARIGRARRSAAPLSGPEATKQTTRRRR